MFQGQEIKALSLNLIVAEKHIMSQFLQGVAFGCARNSEKEMYRLCLGDPESHPSLHENLRNKLASLDRNVKIAPPYMCTFIR